MLNSKTGSRSSIEKRLEVIRRIPIYPKTKKVYEVCNGAWNGILATIDMLAEDKKEGVCFLSSQDKSNETRKAQRLLAQCIEREAMA